MNHVPTGVYVLRSISIIIPNFSTRFYSMYRKILDLKKDISTLPKNGSFRNETCCGLTPLFLKTKVYFLFVSALEINK